MLNIIHTNSAFCKNRRLKTIILVSLFFFTWLCADAGNGIQFIKFQNVCLKSDTMPDDSLKLVEITGTVKSTFHEFIDSTLVTAKIRGVVKDTMTNGSGSFMLRFPLESNRESEYIHLSFSRYDYKSFDTTIVISGSDNAENIEVQLIPRNKILLKGRLYAGNIPLEDATVNIYFGYQIFHLKTLKCYRDEEGYWNCLYLGMFKTELVTDNPEDSVRLSFSKPGFKSQTYQLKFADYSGDMLRFKLRYADSIPDLPGKILCFKLTYPMGSNAGWFIGLSFYSNLSPASLSRVRPGIDLTISSYRRSVSLVTLPGASAESYDTVYTDFFIGPSVLLYITKPYIKRFSTYAGTTFGLKPGSGEFVLQPFLGTRYFIDMRRSFSLDFRYLAYHISTKDYLFSFTGNAIESNQNIKVERILINLGVQINF